MATQQQVSSFIKLMAPLAQHAYKELGKVLPSVCIGMGAVESAWGTAGTCKHNSFFGFKVGSGKTATRFWSGDFFKARTKEEYTVGVHTVITDAFRAYDSPQQCVLNFYELLNTKKYEPVKAGHTYQMQMAEIKRCGYMTSSTEVNSVIKIIEKYGLTRYDAIDSHGQEQEQAKEKNPNPYPTPTNNIRYGSRGNSVRWLQVELNRLGYRLIVDGIVGEKTLDALKSYQHHRGLAVDGVCGPITRQALIGRQEGDMG